MPARPWSSVEDSSDEIVDEEDDSCEDDVSLEKVSAAQQAFVDAQFEKTIDEYAESEIGDLAEVSISTAYFMYSFNNLTI